MFSRAYVEITNVCNMACAFCPGTAREKGFMTPETFALLAGKLRRHTDYLYLHVMGEPLLPPPETMMGALCRYISDESVEDFQPMGSNMGILPPLPELIKGKQERYQAMADRAMAAMESYRKAREER